MSNLREIFYSHSGRLIHKWDHYFEVYEKFLSHFRGKEFNLLEIGISHGGSLQMWQKYFGDKVNIYAIDINPECKKFETEKIKIFIGSQEDPEFLKKLLAQIPKIDVLIDDGGHTMNQQIVSFESLFNHVKDDGIYMVEDVHTSYFHAYGGGLKKKNSFIEYSKNIIDQIHAWHVDNENKMPVSNITKKVNGISFFDSIIVIEKGIRSQPFHIMKGEESIAPFKEVALKKETLFMQIKKKVLPKEHVFKRYFKGKAQ